MTIPVELFVWMCGAVLSMFSVCAHLLIRISGKQSKIELEQALQKQAIAFLERTTKRLERETITA